MILPLNYVYGMIILYNLLDILIEYVHPYHVSTVYMFHIQFDITYVLIRYHPELYNIF